MTQVLPRLAGLLAAVAIALPLSTQAAEHVSVARDKVNLRTGPGTHHAADWLLSRGYPLQVVRRQGSWLKVRDYEGDQGWIYRAMTHTVPHHVVKAERANLREGPGTRHSLVATLSQGEVLKTRRKTTRWVKVETTEGMTGWVARSLVWGW